MASSRENTSENFQLGQFAVDEYRPIKVVCIGAGFCGILAAIRFAQKVPNIELTVYEKEKGIGGTWFVNKYPGLACDIPSHSYQYSFETNVHWSGFYASGPEILAYLNRVVEKYKLMRHIKLQHELTQASWDEVTGKWNLKIRRDDGDRDAAEIEDTADLLFLGVGILHRWSWPDIPGLGDFRGRVLHSAQWDVTEEGGWEEGVKDWGDKAVGIIGNGSSGIQLVTALQPKVKSIVNYARSKTWIGEPFSVLTMLELAGREPGSNDYLYSEKDREAFRDEKYYKEFRHKIEADLNSVAQTTIRGSGLQKLVGELFKGEMKRRLAARPDLLEKIVPQFAVCCRRLTPGPGYLEALCTENTTLQTTPIARVTPTGIELEDGSAEHLDVLICATGFDVSYRFPFPVLGRDGLALNARWAATKGAEAYLSVAVDGFPNLFFGGGPNSAVNSGSLLAIFECQVEYAVSVGLKLQRERLKSIEVKRVAVDDWRAYMETVYTDPCRSWYKNAEGRVIALWPGSCLHAARTLTHPRWEDYEYEYLDGPKNRLAWLGDGQTYNEKVGQGDLAWYLDEKELDYPPGKCRRF
ncbi:FAD/NAD-binding domain-containing protein [Multifurca ochricompacta]|uniref:FAD/NAD-binding domain-containing protein n=1 Tax=Multifurca ochricompacta TaxID=376703 RepID=A0AAD4LZH9_9AGAM|nr:FAD/NAD-binding domain-containing protein [Multifurca ochricompacta]